MSELTGYAAIAKEFSGFCGGFSGKRVLDVGADKKAELIRSIAALGASEAVGLNLDGQPQTFSPTCRFDIGNICHTTFSDNYWDAIVSESSFEHIHKLDTALAEMLRIIKPGGYLISRFGPIWSGALGHHLWVSFEGQTYTYDNLVLPSYCHLLMQPPELYEYCVPKYGPALSQVVVDYVYNAPSQNRYFYEDYARFVRESGFQTIFFCGQMSKNTKFWEKYHPCPPEVYQSLHAKFPGRSNWLYDGVITLLKKP